MRYTYTFLIAASLIAFNSIAHAFNPEASWLLNHEQAKEVATEKNKDILMDFTGSDWCTYCVKLNENVFSKDDFIQEAPKHFVLLKLDYPQDASKQSYAEIEQNKKLREKYQITGFPTIYLADSAGRAYAKIEGYDGESASDYVSKLMELKKVRLQRDEFLQKANSADGAEKAKLIDRAVSLFDPNLALIDYRAEIDRIIELDKNDGAKLKSKYQNLLQLKDVQKRISDIINKNKDDHKTSLTELKALNDELKPTGAVAAELLYNISFLKYQTDDKDGARADLESIIKLDPKSPRADDIRQILNKLFDEKD